jgi:large exoprotein involved in heme utilization and adhesion
MGAPEGRIELSSVAGTSLISIKPVEKGWSLGREQIQNFQDIRLLDEAIVGASGNGGGEIQIQGRNVILTNGSQIVAINNGSEPGGDLTVFALDSVELNGTLSNSILETSLSTTAIATGKAGDITINTRKLAVRDASISTQTRGRNVRLAIGLGGGNLIVNASESVELANGFLSTDTLNAAKAGDLRISTKKLTVRDGALVSVSSQGTGNAGDLEVAAGSIRLENGGKLTATSASGEGGNIKLSQLDLLLLRGGSEISTDATGGTGNGGNITIDTDTLAITNNSNITARAIEGRGGNIRITTQALFVSPDSSISAASQRGIDGVVEIRRPDVDPTAELVVLPANVVDVSGLVAQGCPAGGGNLAAGQSQFVIAGRGGLPPTPAEATRGDTPLADLGTPIQSQEKLTTTAIHSNPTPIESAPPLVEANSWAIGDKGEVILTASSPATPDIPWLKPTSCHSS